MGWVQGLAPTSVEQTFGKVQIGSFYAKSYEALKSRGIIPLNISGHVIYKCCHGNLHLQR